MQKKKLNDEIKEFQKSKKILIPALIFFGITGLFLPVIPGLAFLAMAFLLIFPKQGEDVISKLRNKLNI